MRERSGPAPGLYVHIPFCSAVCPYCDFAVTVGDAARRARFIEALLVEIEALGSDSRRWAPFDTIFLGGGTPSLLGLEELERVLAALDLAFELSEDLQVSMEANPEDVSAESARDWARLGVDRLSLGVQSFDDGELAFLGRRHGPDAARCAIEAAKTSGLTVSVDLIYGLPGRSETDWLRNLEATVELEPDHVSCYQLTVEEGTPFATRSRRGEWIAPPDEAMAGLFFATHGYLERAGYRAYEVSNFAASREHRCRHNRKYWEHAPYLGAGPSAHSFDGVRRWWNRRAEHAWRLEVEAGRSPVEEREELTVVDLALEKLMLGLRTPSGVDLRRLAGIEARSFLTRNAAVLEAWVERGLLEVGDRRLRPTLAGMAQADALARALEI